MTPKEKAEDLINSYRIILMNEDTECGNEILCTSISKQCALIAVDEILNNVMFFWYSPTKDMPKDIVYFVTQRKYWEEVKNEIEKL